MGIPNVYRLRWAIVAVALLSLSSCASSLMQVSQNQSMRPTPSGKATIVFIRASMFAFAIQASLFDVTSGKPEFIGVSSSKTKVAYEVNPGKHVFMVVSESADFMKANMSASKTYYALVTPRPGLAKARFSLRPVRKTSTDEYNLGSKEFADWEQSSKFVENTDKSQQWFAENKSDIDSKHASIWPVWQRKPAEEIAALSLEAEDGR